MAMYKHPKGIAFTLLLLTLLSVLTGCLRSGVDITVNDDDTGQVEVSFGISRDYYQMILSEYGTEPYEGKATTEITDGDTTYICVSETKKFQTLDELKDILLSLEYTSEETESIFSSMESDGTSDSEEAEKTDTHIFKTADVSKEDLFFSQSYTLHLVTNAMESGGSEDELFSIPTDSVFRVLLNITLPGTIHAEGAVIHDNTASYTITDLENENVIHVESSRTDTVRIVAVIVAVVCTVALIALFAGGNKNKSAARKIAEKEGF